MEPDLVQLFVAELFRRFEAPSVLDFMLIVYLRPDRFVVDNRGHIALTASIPALSGNFGDSDPGRNRNVRSQKMTLPCCPVS